MRSCLWHAGPHGPPQRLQSILKSNPTVTTPDTHAAEPIVRTLTRPRVTYAAWESLSTDTSFSVSRGQSAGRASLRMHGSRNASFANDADDASTPLGFAQSMPRQASMPETSAHKLDLTALRFSSEANRSEWDSRSALAALTEGQARCAVTGDAFDYLLQCEDLSALEAVMRNAVVFARMKPQQKGQVMDLLTIRGLYQMHKGQVRHIQASPVIDPQLQHSISRF